MRWPGRPEFVDFGLDFDGVVNSYDSGWDGVTSIGDPPVDGAIEWIHRTLNRGHTIAIHSCRSPWWYGRLAMRSWLKTYAGNLWYESMGTRGLEDVKFPKHKPSAKIYIDDRGLRFDGRFPNPEGVLAWQPWNKTGGPIEILRESVVGGPSARPCHDPRIMPLGDCGDVTVPIDCGNREPCRARARLEPLIDDQDPAERFPHR